MLVTAFAVVLVGTACGNQETDTAQQPPTSEQQAPGGQPVADESSGETAPPAPPGTEDGNVPDKQISGPDLPEGFPQEVSAKRDGRTLEIVAQEGGCGQAGAELVEQTPEKVVVNLVETEPQDAQACTMDIRYPTVTVQLERPLGERTVELHYEHRKE
ncbi:hypothetical protein [Amycolatopsis cihanbeyliensis]|uniref:Uncharacterized protein n=1 Tax=Amycolatopsis cihanbeyliensis TaxID=1128664 RepID=A0A542DDI1_AMYCI|nr:hypothetical protein [Amycolatopsis cihanbeyliensis]TQJ01125.1 hypothetical protein FB471_0790 [Amycolatopsis cihanbeyliensis]